MTQSDGRAPHSVRDLLRSSVPALVIGVGSALLLLGLFWIAGRLEHVLWEAWPNAMGVPDDSAWWTVVVLTLTGVAVGLVAWKVPGHAGPDPATQSLVSPPLPLRVVPSLALALVIMLAGGPSLGPENPILAIAVALTLVAGHRALPEAPATAWVGLATAGMIGAMFGTPVAAALILSEMLKSSEDKPLWDQLFSPLVAAAAASATVALVEQPVFSINVAPYTDPAPIDLLSASLIAIAAALLGLAAVYAFPHVHRLFHRIGNPLLMLTAGGLVLGLLGALGRRITLFRGVDQMRELAENAGTETVAGLALIIVVKLVALLISATSGFPGGRIFPAVFLGVAVGLLANAVVTEIPVTLCVSAGVLGMVLAISRDGWLSLFIAVVVAGEVMLTPVLLVATLPTWLLLTGKPQMVLEPPTDTAAEPRQGV